MSQGLIDLEISYEEVKTIVNENIWKNERIYLNDET